MRRVPLSALLRALFSLVATVSCARGPAPSAAPSPAAPVSKLPAPVSPPPAAPPTPHAYASQDAAPPLPPIPGVDGPLQIKVVYPPQNHELTARDSTFILGSVGTGLAQLSINGIAVPVFANGAFLAWLPVPPLDRPRYELFAIRGEQTATVTVNVRRRDPSLVTPAAPLVTTDLPEPRVAELTNVNEDATSDTDKVAILRPTPAGTYKWFLFPGTRVEITGMRGDSYRVKLDSDLEVWAESREVKLLAESTTVRRHRIASNARVVATDSWSDLRIPVTERPAYQVEERRDALVLTLYATNSNVDVVNFATNDEVIRDVTWEQATSGRVRFTVHLRRAPFGWLALWERGTFVLRVRRAPTVDAARPLAGRVIALDPGHPPVGSTGPTGLYEGDAVLDVAEQLKPMLESRGATVVMTRTTRDPVALGLRAITARRENADALVSIHLNALPDGANPFRVSGTGTYFFHDHSEPLARAVQRGMVHEMGLRDLGINYDNLAVARTTWMPAILCEGAFVIVPEQEAALRDPSFQRRYALGILEGLEEYFRALAAEGNRP
jgi:N-acetylmuramoyl-L-alanine amidase